MKKYKTDTDHIPSENINKQEVSYKNNQVFKQLG